MKMSRGVHKVILHPSKLLQACLIRNLCYPLPCLPVRIWKLQARSCDWMSLIILFAFDENFSKSLVFSRTRGREERTKTNFIWNESVADLRAQPKLVIPWTWAFPWSTPCCRRPALKKPTFWSYPISNNPGKLTLGNHSPLRRPGRSFWYLLLVGVLDYRDRTSKMTWRVIELYQQPSVQLAKCHWALRAILTQAVMS